MPPAPTSRQRAGNAAQSSNQANRPLYAIDFTAVACGKRIANTKRRVRWRFGLANPDALAAGETGTACRGEEHDVTLVWSVTSGKRLILADGQEVHYSNSRSAVLDFSWTMRGNHVLKVVAHATAPMSAEPGFRQYDFYVDGRSFFSFPKVYRLGLTGNKTMSRDEHGAGVPAALRSGGREQMAVSSGRRKSDRGSGNIASIEMPHNPDEEEAYLREAIKNSLMPPEAKAKGKGEEKPDGGRNGSNERQTLSAEATDLLIDFMDDFDSTGNTLNASPTAAAGNALVAAPVQANNQWATAAPDAGGWAAAPAPPTDNGWNQPPAASPAVAAPTPTYDQYGGGANAYATAPSNPFQPAAPADARQSFAQPPPPPVDTRQSFAQPPPAPTADPFSVQAYAAPAAAANPMAAYGQAPSAPPVASPFSPQAPAPVASEPAPAATEAPPAASPSSGGAFLTMGSLSSDGLLAGGNANDDSKAKASADMALQNLMGSIDAFGITGAAAKPPAAANNPFDSNNIMSNATLGEMKSKQGGGEKKSIMNNSSAGQAGAMVMANNQGGNWGLGGQQQQQQAPQYSMSGGYGQPAQQPQMGGYGQQQQQQPQMGAMGGYGQQQPQMGMGQPMMGQQPPMQQQGYGAPQYGQQPPMQQNQWGAPSY